MRRMQPIDYDGAKLILGLKPLVVLLSLQFHVKYSVEVLILFYSDSPCYLPCVMLSAAYKKMKGKCKEWKYHRDHGKYK